MENIEKLSPTGYEIVQEISKVLERLGAERGVFAAVHSWGDTLPEKEVLQMLKDQNSSSQHRPHQRKPNNNMNLTEEQYEELKSLVKPLQQWLNDNCHPHVKAIVDSAVMELVEGITSVQRD